MTNINLLPAEYREKEKFNTKRILIIVFILLLAFGIAYLYYSLDLRIDYKEKQLATMKTELAVLEKIIKEVKNLEKDKKLVEERVQVLEGIVKNQTRLSRILGEFSASILDEVWINNLSLNANQTFDLTATTYNNYLIAKCMVNLKDDLTFDNIELGYVQKGMIKEDDKDTEIVSFRLSGLFIPKVVE